MDSRYLCALKMRPYPGGDYLAELPAVQFLLRAGELLFSGDVTFFVGENGAGKSTLLEAIAVAAGFNPEGGSRNFRFSTADDVSGLAQYLTLVRTARRERDGFFLRAESFFNVATNLDALDDAPGGPRLIDSYGGISLHRQSHGESFLALVQNRFGGNGLYLLDEPEAALSPTRQMALLVEMRRLAQKNSQFIIATHSPILLAYPGAQILEFSEQGIQPVAYRDCAHYRLTRYFLDNPEKMLRELLDEREAPIK